MCGVVLEMCLCACVVCICTRPWLISPVVSFVHSELFEVNHIRTIYHMFIALLILFILSTLVVDFIDEGRQVTNTGW